MDESLYDGFDKRAHDFFAQLEASTSRESPQRMVLKRQFIAEVRRVLHLESSNVNKLRQSFNIAFLAYRSVKRRDGEAYIFHVLRGTLVLIWAFSQFRVFDLQLCYVMFQHDSYEETEDTWYSQALIRSLVRLGHGHSAATDVGHLTQSEEESDAEYMLRLLSLGGWRPLLVKIVDRTDNIWTLDKDDIERSKRKLHDTQLEFVKVEKRVTELVKVEVEAKRLEKDWLEVTSFLVGYLWYAVEVKKRKFGIE